MPRSRSASPLCTLRRRSYEPDLGPPVLTQGVEEALQCPSVVTFGRPHQPDRVVVDDEGEVAVASLVGDLVDPNPAQAAEGAASRAPAGTSTRMVPPSRCQAAVGQHLVASPRVASGEGLSTQVLQCEGRSDAPPAARCSKRCRYTRQVNPGVPVPGLLGDLLDGEALVPTRRERTAGHKQAISETETMSANRQRPATKTACYLGKRSDDPGQRPERTGLTRQGSLVRTQQRPPSKCPVMGRKAYPGPHLDDGAGGRRPSGGHPGVRGTAPGSRVS